MTCATMLNWLQVIEIDGITKTRYEHWYPKGSLLRFANSLRTWGESGIVKVKKKGESKLQTVGVPCMFVGYSMNHAKDVWRMWNPTTNRIITSRDVKWQHRMFYPSTTPSIREPSDPFPDLVVREGDNVNGDDNVTSSIGYDNPNHNDVMDGDDNPNPNDVMDGDDSPNPNNVMDGGDSPNPNNVMDDNDNNEESKTHTRSGRQVRTPKRLIASNEWGQTAINYMSLNSAEQNYYTALMTASSNEYMPYEVVNIALNINELAAVGAGIGGGFLNTSELRVLKYKEAINGPDREHWLKAIEEEHERMVKNNAFKTVKRKDVPKKCPERI